MLRSATVFALSLCAAAALAAPAQAQLWFFPDFATPSAFGTPSTFVAATYGRGLNDVSGKLDSYAVSVGRTGMGDRFTVTGGVGVINDVNNQWTFGGEVGADLLPSSGTTQVTLQGGAGYMSIDLGTGSLTMWRFPIGLALKTQVTSESVNVTPWVMPRLNISRASAGGLSDTSTDFGASGGVNFTMPSGLGFHIALDVLSSNSSMWYFGGGVHYVIG